jgi:hypothetical protein
MDKKYCDNCVYSGTLTASTTKVCNYLLVTNKRRPCPPGEGCTVKVVRKRSRRKKGAEDGEVSV